MGAGIKHLGGICFAGNLGLAGIPGPCGFERPCLIGHIVAVMVLYNAEACECVAGVIRIWVSGRRQTKSVAWPGSQECWRCLLGRLVSQPTVFILTTAQDISRQPFAAVQIVGYGSAVVLVLSRTLNCSLYQRPTASQPMTVASVHDLVGSPGEAPFGCVLSRRQPPDQGIQIEILVE